MTRPILFAALLALASVTAAWADDSCGPLRVVATVDMLRGRGGRVAIPVTMAGERKLMLLDTGAAVTSLTPRVVDELKLPRTRAAMEIRDVLGNSSDELATIPDFALGRLTAGRIHVFVLPDAEDSEYSSHSDSQAGLPNALAGIFGSDFLRPYDLDLDFAAAKMRLISQDHCEGRVVYWHPDVFAIIPFEIDKSGGIVFTMTLDGKDLRVLLDTGATDSVMRSDVAKREFDIDGPAAGDPAAAQSVVNRQRVPGVFDYRFHTLATDGLAIANPLITILPDVADQRIKASQAWYDRTHGVSNTDLILGMRELTRLHVYIAYGERKLYLSPAAPPPDSTPPQAAPPPAH